MKKPWKPNRRERRILLVLLTGAGNLWGLKIFHLAQVSSWGGMYVVLAKLEQQGWVTAESSCPFMSLKTGESRRRMRYQLTDKGRAGAMEALGLIEDASDRAGANGF
jgi:DNA-binding PadR family transcriptional regulator